MSDSTPTFGDFWSLRYSAGGHPLTRLFSQRIGALAGYAALRAGLSPSAVTLTGTGVFILAAVLYAGLPSSWGAAAVCMLLLQLGYGLDCADGQLARATQRTSAFGAWLDVACDYARNVLLGAAGAIWMVRCGLALELTAIAAVLFIAGTAVQLHTVMVLRHACSGRSSAVPATRSGLAYGTAMTLIDTATVLFCLALLRGYPAALGVYLATLGIGYVAVAVYLAHGALLRAADAT